MTPTGHHSRSSQDRTILVGTWSGPNEDVDPRTSIQSDETRETHLNMVSLKVAAWRQEDGRQEPEWRPAPSTPCFRWVA